MRNAIVRLLKKIEIDINSQDAFEQQVFNDTFNEFVQQFSSGPFITWKNFISQTPSGEAQLNAIIGKVMHISVSSLRGFFPGGFKDFSNSHEIKFEKASLRILESDRTNMNSHRIAIDFVFPEMTLIDSFENKIIVAKDNQSNSISSHIPIDTFIIELDPSVSICSYKSF